MMIVNTQVFSYSLYYVGKIGEIDLFTTTISSESFLYHKNNHVAHESC